MPTGSTQVDFGAFPGSSHTTAAVTGQTAITAASLAEAWMLPATTVDHSPDEHVLEPIKIIASDVVAGTGFTIHALYQGIGDTQPWGKFNVGWVWL